MLPEACPAILPCMISNDGKSALMLASGCSLLWLTAALEDAGWEVCCPTSEYSSRKDLEGDSRQLLREVTPDLVIHCHMPSFASVLHLGDSEPSDWRRSCEIPLRRTLLSLQVARSLVGDRGAIVGLGPAFPLNGVAGLVALGAGAEGQRTLVKAAARQWIASEIAVNWVALKTERLLPQLADVPQIGRFEVGSYGRRPPDDARLAALITALAGDAGLAMAGQTLIADGGDWMTP